MTESLSQGVAMIRVWMVVAMLIIHVPSDHRRSQACGDSPQRAITLEAMSFDPSYPRTQVVSVQRNPDGEEILIRETHETNGEQITALAKSLDGGSSWAHVGPDYSQEGGDEFHIRSMDKSVVYRRDGLLLARSYDLGAHWKTPDYIIDGMTPSQFVAKYAQSGELYVKLSAIHPARAMIIVASFRIVGSQKPKDASSYIPVPGLYISHDAGDHWTTLSRDLLNGSPYEISKSNPNIQFGVSGSGPVRSFNGGIKWAPVGEQIEISRPTFPIDEENIRAAAKELGTQPDVIRRRALESSKAKFWDIIIHPKDSSFILIVSNKGLYQSVDGGSIWHRLPVGRRQVGDINSAMYGLDDPHTIYVGTSEYIAKSSDGGCTFHKIFQGQ